MWAWQAVVARLLTFDPNLYQISWVREKFVHERVSYNKMNIPADLQRDFSKKLLFKSYSFFYSLEHAQ